MKLIKLTILEKFRSLDKTNNQDEFENFTVIFRDDVPGEQWQEFHPYCFAGLNGSGKSNVLEALANIFYHLECCTLEKTQSEYLQSEFKQERSAPNAYELEYYIIPRDNDKISVGDYINVFIKKAAGSVPMIKIKAQDQIEESEFINIGNSIRRYLPEFVIGYSSGENEILSLPFVKSRLLQLDEYYYHLRNQKKLKLNYNLEQKPTSSLVYIDYHMSQAVLLANFLLQDEDTLKPIKDHLGIERLHSFRLVINNLKIYNEKDDPELGYLLPLVEDTIAKFRNCATVRYREMAKEDDKTLKFEMLDFYFDENYHNQQIISEMKTAFRKHFGTPLQLFKAFQVLTLLNLRVVDRDLKTEIYNSDSLYAMYKIPSLKEQEHVFHFNLFKIKKKDSSDKMLLKSFSDGEHQFLHTIGICLMLRDKSTLFLLDEPETHFNPEWRSEFISLLKESLNKSGVNHLMRDVIITSHSPFIISDCYPDKVIVFERGKQPQSAFEKNFRTFGTSIDIIMESIFRRNNTIGDLSGKIIEEIQNEIRDRESLTREEVKMYKNKTASLGDSMEKILLFTKLNELSK